MPVPTQEQINEKLSHIETSRQIADEYLDAAVVDAKKGELDLLKVLTLQQKLRDQVNEIVALQEITKVIP